MLQSVLTEIFDRDLQKLKDEILLYVREEDLWVVRGEISNSAGNLCLHLAGNLNHFIGAVLGNSGYVRERDREFSDKNVPRAQLIASLEATREMVARTLAALPAAAFEDWFPEKKRGEMVRMDHMLVHLLGHLSYHLGQINYHRRLIAVESN